MRYNNIYSKNNYYNLYISYIISIYLLNYYILLYIIIYKVISIMEEYNNYIIALLIITLIVVIYLYITQKNEAELDASSLDKKIQSLDADLLKKTELLEREKQALVNKVNELKLLQGKYDTESDRLSTVKSNLATMKAKYDGCLSHKDDIASQLQDKSDDLATMKAKYEAESKKLSTVKGNLSTMKANYEAESKNLSTVKGNLATMKAKYEAESKKLSSNLVTMKAKYEAESKNLSTVKGNLAIMKAKYEAESKNLSTAMSNLATMEDKYKAESNKLSTAERVTADIRNKLDTMKGKYEAESKMLSNNLATMEDKYNIVSKSLSTANDRISDIRNNLVVMEDKYNTERKYVHSIKDDLSKTYKKLHAMKAKYDDESKYVYMIKDKLSKTYKELHTMEAKYNNERKKLYKVEQTIKHMHMMIDKMADNLVKAQNEVKKYKSSNYSINNDLENCMIEIDTINNKINTVKDEHIKVVDKVQTEYVVKRATKNPKLILLLKAQLVFMNKYKGDTSSFKNLNHIEDILKRISSNIPHEHNVYSSEKGFPKYLKFCHKDYPQILKNTFNSIADTIYKIDKLYIQYELNGGNPKKPWRVPYDILPYPILIGRFITDSIEDEIPGYSSMTPHNKNYAVYEKYYEKEIDYGRNNNKECPHDIIHKADIQNCLPMCVTTPECQGIHYSSDTGECWLNSNLNRCIKTDNKDLVLLKVLKRPSSIKLLNKDLLDYIHTDPELLIKMIGLFMEIMLDIVKDSCEEGKINDKKFTDNIENISMQLRNAPQDVQKFVLMTVPSLIFRDIDIL